MTEPVKETGDGRGAVKREGRLRVTGLGVRLARSGPDVTSATAAWHAARFPEVVPARMREKNSNGSQAFSAASAKITIAIVLPQRLARMIGRRP